MKTITVKLQEQEAKELDLFIKKSPYPSKSEFIRNIIIEKLDIKTREKQGWLALAENSMNKIWDNKKDEAAWSKYL